MKKLLFAVVLAAPIAFNAQAMKKSPGEEGREIMKAVYDRFASSLNSGTFSEADVKAFNDFPTQSTRDLIFGAKPGFISEDKKIQGLIDFFNSNNGEFATKAIGILTALKEKLKANSEAVSTEELKQGNALATLINMLFESRRKFRAPELVKKEALASFQFFNGTLQNIIQQRAEAPAKQAAAQKKQREEQEMAQRFREERQAEEHAKEEAKAQAQKYVRAENTRKKEEALIEMQRPEKAALKAEVNKRLTALTNKLADGTLMPQDVEDYIKYYERTEGQGSDTDVIIKKRMFVEFFNKDETNKQLIDNMRALLSVHELSEEQDKKLRALSFLASRLFEVAGQVGLEVQNRKTLKSLEADAEGR